MSHNTAEYWVIIQLKNAAFIQYSSQPLTEKRKQKIPTNWCINTQSLITQSFYNTWLLYSTQSFYNTQLIYSTQSLQYSIPLQYSTTTTLNNSTGFNHPVIMSMALCLCTLDEHLRMYKTVHFVVMATAIQLSAWNSTLVFLTEYKRPLSTLNSTLAHQCAEVHTELYICTPLSVQKSTLVRSDNCISLKCKTIYVYSHDNYIPLKC